ncbi:JmjC domain protein [Aphelenchoides besseyi]|nr:JmjC domain protein [Aphelenchoides besseyi]KAI6236537.1 JmjC domain protein [Aphelenchoides besseyi]
MSSTFAHKRTRKRVAEAKRKARSELNDCGWEPHQTAASNAVDLSLEHCRDTITRISADEVTVEEFVERYEKPGIPVIISGLTDQWAAHEKWTIPRLYRKYRNQKFKCGEDDDGYSVKLKLKYFLDYALSTTDDSPLYIFDSSFGERSKVKKLLDDYEVPSYFSDDLFRYASEKRRPPYRWIVLGPARSGTAIHIDPLGTSAWNALISGHKKWCLIHPSAPKQLIKPRRDESGKHPDEAITWFSTVYHRVCSPSWYPEYQAIHAVQCPGDVMFVPSGWWHVVLNLDNTIAVTQNFCSLSNLHQVWMKTVKSRPKYSKHWLRALQTRRPEVVKKISEISRTTDWINVAEEQSSDSSSSSSSSSSESDSDSGTEMNDGIPVQRKRRLSIRVEELDDEIEKKRSNCESCPNKLRRSP